MKLVYIAYGLYTLLSIGIVSGSFLGYVTFGYGLGDWLHIITTTILWIVISIIIIVNWKQRVHKNQMILTIGMIACIVFLLLKITILRGTEYKWNGDIFYHN